MRKHLLKTIIAGGLLLTFNACKKEPATTSAGPGKPGSIHLINDDDVIFRDITVVPTDMINSDNFLDENDQKIKCAMYELSRAFIESVSPEELDYIFAATMSDDNAYEDVLYKTVFEHFPELRERVQTKIADGTNFELPFDFSSFEEIEAVLTRENYDYDPAISLINNTDHAIASANADHILLCTGIEYDNLDEEPVDDYHAFYLTAGELKDIRINEVEAQATLWPFFSTTLHLKPTGGTPLGGTGGPTSNPAWMQSNLNLRFKQIKIYDRHESSRLSEIFVCGKSQVGISTSPPVYPVKNLYGTAFNSDWFCESRELAEIHKNDCNGSVRNLNGLGMWIYNWNPSNVLMEHYVTAIQVYERDWAASKQNFGRVPNGSSTSVDQNYIIWGRATYQSDYYYANPGNNDGRAATAIDDARKDAIWFQNGLWKGDTYGEVFMKIE